jgi:hypothetical protein
MFKHLRTRRHQTPRGTHRTVRRPDPQPRIRWYQAHS